MGEYKHGHISGKIINKEMKPPELIDDLILNMFKESKGAFVSGQTMSNKIRISRTAVWKHIEGLRREGYVIVSAPSRGYSLVVAPDKLSASEIKRGINTKTIGREVQVFNAVVSTNDIAMEMGARGMQEGLVIVAESQSHGRGRLGRTWISPGNVNIYASILFRPELSPVYAPTLTMMASLATASAISKTTGLEAKIKWPNDILIGSKKVSGILTEMNAEEEMINYVVVGIGINVNMREGDLPDGLRIPATSLMECIGEKVDRTALLKQLIETIDSDYDGLKNKGIMSVVKRWRENCITLNKKVKATLPGEVITGVAEDVTQQGGLVIKMAEGHTKVIYAGDITILE